jgi:hypothetical protein
MRRLDPVSLSEVPSRTHTSYAEIYEVIEALAPGAKAETWVFDDVESAVRAAAAVRMWCSGNDRDVGVTRAMNVLYFWRVPK